MHMYQHTQSKYICYILVFNTKNNCLLSFRSFFLKKKSVLKYLKCIDCWLLKLKLNHELLLQNLTLLRIGTKVSSVLFIPLNDLVRCRNLRSFYLFHDILHLLFTAWTWSAVPPSGWIQSNDIFCHLTIERALEIFKWWLHWASLQPEIEFVIYASRLNCILTRNLDISFFLAQLCGLWIHTKFLNSVS